MRRRSRAVVGLGLGVVLVGAGWCGWQVFHVYRDLSAAATQATVLQQAVTAGDPAAAQQSVDALAAHVSAARARTSGSTWRVLGHAPFLGDDVRGIGVVSGVLDDLVDDGLKPVVASVGDFNGLTPKQGQIPIEGVTRLQQPVAQAATAFAAADQRLEATDSSGYLGRWQLKYRDLARTVSDASDNLAAADTAMKLLPSMLGADGPRRYLVIFQSNAEVRATGGLPGVAAVLEVDQGKIAPFRLVSGNSFLETPEPVLPLTPAEEEIYGPQLGTYFLDANFTPDFARAADLWRARWEQENPPLDGILAVDPVALSYLLAATGPVQAGPLQLTADNAVPTLLNTIYAQTADPFVQDEIFRTVGKALLDQIVSGVGSPTQLLSGLGRSADEHRVFVHSFHKSEQKLIAGSAVSGDLITDPTADPQVGVYLNDNTGAKMSYYLRTIVDVTGRTCTGDAQELDGAARLTSVAPKDAATSLPAAVTGGGLYGVPAGQQIVAVRLYGPVGGTVSDIELDDKPIPISDVVVQDGRPVATTYIQVGPGSSVDLSFRMTTGPGQTGDVHVGVTPGVDNRDTSSVVDSVC